MLHMACAVARELPEETARELHQRVWAVLRQQSDAYDAFCEDALRLCECGLCGEALVPTAWSVAELALAAVCVDSLPSDRLVAVAQGALEHGKNAPAEVVEALCGLLCVLLRRVDAASVQGTVAWRATVGVTRTFHR